MTFMSLCASALSVTLLSCMPVPKEVLAHVKEKSQLISKLVNSVMQSTASSYN